MGKRMFDVICSLILLVLFSPLMFVIACLVKATSDGPVIFRQKRVGYEGKLFTLYKFRSMMDNSGRPFDSVTEGDRRITMIGKIMRPIHFDELPQLWNVLRGDMSMVGPRPDTQEYVRAKTKNDTRYQLRNQVKPGLTGVVQVRGRHWLQAHPEDALKLEIAYILGRNLLKDFRILLATLPAILRRQGV